MSPTLKVMSGSIRSIFRFQNWMLSVSPSRSRGPGKSSRKKSASCSSKDRSPRGTILIGRPAESDSLEVVGTGADSRVEFRVGHLDGDRAVEVVVVRKIDP